MQSSDFSVALQASDLELSINQHQILQSLNFSVRQGEVYALLGGNGAGKSSTLKTFLGFNIPTKGNVSVLGKDLQTNLNELRAKIAYLPESVTLYPHLSGRENVHYFLSLAKIEKSDTQIEQAFTKVALQSDAWDKHMQTYSKGMRQKTAIALALLREAPIFLLDEPTSGLDPTAIDEFEQLARELANSGAAVLMVTHDVYGACQIADRIGLLRNGQLVGEFAASDNAKIDTEQVHLAFSAKEQA